MNDLQIAEVQGKVRSGALHGGANANQDVCN